MPPPKYYDPTTGAPRTLDEAAASASIQGDAWGARSANPGFDRVGQ